MRLRILYEGVSYASHFSPQVVGYGVRPPISAGAPAAPHSEAASSALSARFPVVGAPWRAAAARRAAPVLLLRPPRAARAARRLLLPPSARAAPPRSPRHRGLGASLQNRRRRGGGASAGKLAPGCASSTCARAPPQPQPPRSRAPRAAASTCASGGEAAAFAAAAATRTRAAAAARRAPPPAIRSRDSSGASSDSSATSSGDIAGTSATEAARTRRYSSCSPPHRFRRGLGRRRVLHAGRGGILRVNLRPLLLGGRQGRRRIGPDGSSRAVGRARAGRVVQQPPRARGRGRGLARGRQSLLPRSLGLRASVPTPERAPRVRHPLPPFHECFRAHRSRQHRGRPDDAHQAQFRDRARRLRRRGHRDKHPPRVPRDARRAPRVLVSEVPLLDGIHLCTTSSDEGILIIDHLSTRALIFSARGAPGPRQDGVDWVPAQAVRERGGDECDRPLVPLGAARPARPPGDRPTGIRLGRHRHFVRERRVNFVDGVTAKVGKSVGSRRYRGRRPGQVAFLAALVWAASPRRRPLRGPLFFCSAPRPRWPGTPARTSSCAPRRRRAVRGNAASRCRAGGRVHAATALSVCRALRRRRRWRRRWRSRADAALCVDRVRMRRAPGNAPPGRRWWRPAFEARTPGFP